MNRYCFTQIIVLHLLSVYYCSFENNDSDSIGPFEITIVTDSDSIGHPCQPVTSNPAAKTTEPETFQQRVQVCGKPTSWAENSTLSCSIGDRERIRSGLVPLDEAGLIEVHEHHKSEEDSVDPPVAKVVEHNDMITVVKGLPII